MLGKLIKHEFRATGRILLPVYLVMLLTAALVRGFQVLTEQTAGEFMRALAVLSVLLFSAAVFGGSILAFVLMIYRFYKNLMTDEGYLMFTLPVTTGQLIWSKMIVSAVWLLATAAMDVLSMFISVFDSAAWRDIFQLPGLLWQQLREYAGNLGLIPARTPSSSTAAARSASSARRASRSRRNSASPISAATRWRARSTPASATRGQTSITTRRWSSCRRTSTASSF